jgi:hypothetical protein
MRTKTNQLKHSANNGEIIVSHFLPKNEPTAKMTLQKKENWQKMQSRNEKKSFAAKLFHPTYFKPLLASRAARTKSSLNLRDRCYDFLNRQKIGEKLSFSIQFKAKLYKNSIIALFFEKNAIFLPKIGKICRNL